MISTIEKLIMTTQSQIYLLAFSNIDETTCTHQYTPLFFLSPHQRRNYFEDYSIRNILIGFH